MKQVGEVCWLGGLPVRKGLGDWRVVGLWGSQQSFIRGGGRGEGVHLKEGPTSYPFIYHF